MGNVTLPHLYVISPDRHFTAATNFPYICLNKHFPENIGKRRLNQESNAIHFYFKTELTEKNQNFIWRYVPLKEKHQKIYFFFYLILA